MMWAVIASGPSLTPAQVEQVRGLKVVAVSDAYRLAPWADAMCSQDWAWWNHHNPEFAGRKFRGCPKDVEGVEKFPDVPSGCNSGVLGIRVARFLGATEIVLLGFDGGSSHFFGAHPTPLKTTSEARIPVHHEQHRQEAHACKWAGVKVWNCSPGTAIEHYPKAELSEVLCGRG